MSARILSVALLFGAALPMSAPAVAAPPQEAATSAPVQSALSQSASIRSAPTVDQYLCTFAGKCGGAVATDSVTRDAPQTKGFRLARPTADTRPAAMTSPIGNGRSRAAARLTSVHPGRTPRAGYAGSNSARSANLASAAPSPAGAATPGAGNRPRADLMIGFELNSDRLSSEGASAARTFARSLQMPELAGKRFLIEGHTDLRGGQALNAGLSARRAQAVADFLAGEGVARDRLQARGFGASVPLPGHRVTDPANRRVEAELIS